MIIADYLTVGSGLWFLRWICDRLYRQLWSARRIKPSLRRANKGETAITIRTSHFVEMQPGNTCNNLTVVQGKGGSTRVPFSAALSYNSLKFK